MRDSGSSHVRRRHAARFLSGALGAVVVGSATVMALALPASTQVPPDPAPTPPLPIPVPPLPLPTEEPTEEPPPPPEPTPQPSPTETRAPTPVEPPPPEPSVGEPEPFLAGLDVIDRPAAGVAQPQPRPEVAPVPQDPRPSPQPPVVAAEPLAAALPGVFGLSLFTVFAGLGVMVGVPALLRSSGLLVVIDDRGGVEVQMTKRWRLLAGLALVAAAAVVGVIGYLKISIETQVPVQVVYLASAGFAVVVLAVAGGSLFVAEQLRADERRIQELEDAVRGIADAVRPAVQHPPRLRTDADSDADA